MDAKEIMEALGSAFHELNELKVVKERLQNLVVINKTNIERVEERIKSIKDASGTARYRTTKEEMLAIRAKIRITVREAAGDALYPHQIAENAQLDVEQVRRILRDEAAGDGPIRNLLESRKESKYYWDLAWRPNTAA